MAHASYLMHGNRDFLMARRTGQRLPCHAAARPHPARPVWHPHAAQPRRCAVHRRRSLSGIPPPGAQQQLAATVPCTAPAATQGADRTTAPTERAGEAPQADAIMDVNTGCGMHPASRPRLSAPDPRPHPPPGTAICIISMDTLANAGCSATGTTGRMRCAATAAA